MTGAPRPRSVRAYLLAWIIIPIAVFIVIDTVSLYRSALESTNAAYDRMLVASAHSIGDLLKIEDGQLVVTLPYAALEIYETDSTSRMMYRVSGFSGEFASGYEDLRKFAGPPRPHATYPSLVELYEDDYRGEPVRVAALHQPVASNTERGIALVQVAESLENRKRAAQRILYRTLMRQTMLAAVVTIVTLVVVALALRPLEALRAQLDDRRADDLSPLSAPGAPRELQPMVRALNDLIGRLKRSLDQQNRFVADASHQLRTPLAVLKTQLQSGLRGDAPTDVIMREMAGTVERATGLANQMLSLAKVEQRKEQPEESACDLAALAREAAVELSPLISEKDLDFELDAQDARLTGDPWMVGELIRNLLHNAIRYTPPGSKIGIRTTGGDGVTLVVWDSGPGLAGGDAERLLEPFVSGRGSTGSGIGLTICREIAASMNAAISLKNRLANGKIAGLDARVRFPSTRVLPPQA